MSTRLYPRSFIYACDIRNHVCIGSIYPAVLVASFFYYRSDKHRNFRSRAVKSTDSGYLCALSRGRHYFAPSSRLYTSVEPMIMWSDLALAMSDYYRNRANEKCDCIE